MQGASASLQFKKAALEDQRTQFSGLGVCHYPVYAHQCVKPVEELDRGPTGVALPLCTRCTSPDRNGSEGGAVLPCRCWCRACAGIYDEKEEDPEEVLVEPPNLNACLARLLVSSPRA